MSIIEELFAMADTSYREFNCALIPTVDKSRVVGVRVPALRALAKSISATPQAEQFLAELPHIYFEEYMVHGFIIECIRDFDRCVEELDRFLPYVDNWAVTDSTSPRILCKHKGRLIVAVERWLASRHTYTVRYAILMLMKHYLDADFRPEYMKRVSEVRSDEYYINMMISWYFATALAKQYDNAVRYLEEYRLSPWVHNKTIQKARESRCLSDDKKAYLGTLKINKPTSIP